MKSTDDQGIIPVIVASEADTAYIRAIPTAQATAGDGSVSLDLGLPPECATSVSAGGKRPEMKDMNGIWNLFSRAIQSLQAYRGVYSASFATAIGGYPEYALVSDSSGNFWVSTADDNTTTPGADGASWQSLFNGYATQEWANGRFLQLADTDEQTVTGPVTFEGETSVPSVTTFTGTDALNAKTAESRYPASVPATGQTRITRLVQDANDRTVSNSAVLANFSDLSSRVVQSGAVGTDGSYTIQTFTDPSTPSGHRVRMTGTFYVSEESYHTITLPLSLNGVFPAGYGASTQLSSPSYSQNWGAQVVGVPTTTEIVLFGQYMAASSPEVNGYILWWIEGY